MTDTTRTPLTPEREQQIRARDAAATPGPWGRAAAHGPYFHADSPADEFGIRVGDVHFGYGPQTAAEREFIAHAREDVPALLSEIDRQRAELARIETGIQGAVDRSHELDDDDPRVLGLLAALRIVQGDRFGTPNTHGGAR
jgi:hypothetical protein